MTSTLAEKYTVHPDYQIEFDQLQEETIAFVDSNKKLMHSIQHTIDQLQHLVVIIKLHSKKQPLLSIRFHQDKPSRTGSSVDTLPSFTAKASVVDDIAGLIETYNRFYSGMDGMNAIIIEDLEKLRTQSISEDEEMQWYRESLRIKKREAADLSEEVKALKSLSDVAIAQVKELSEGKNVCLFVLFCAMIAVYMWYKF